MGASLILSLDPATLLQLEEAALARKTTTAELAQSALRMFLTEQSILGEPLEPWQEELISEGVAAAERGDFASDQDVQEAFRRFRA